MSWEICIRRTEFVSTIGIFVTWHWLNYQCWKPIRFEENISNVFNHWGREQNVGGSEGRPLPPKSRLSFGKLCSSFYTKAERYTFITSWIYLTQMTSCQQNCPTPMSSVRFIVIGLKRKAVECGSWVWTLEPQ
jgi:hypothetical protein